MRAEEIKGLMEAYSQVHGAPEVLSEEVVEEDTEVLDEQGRGSGANPSQMNQSVSGAQLMYGASGKPKTPSSRPTNVRGGGRSPAATAAAKPTAKPSNPKFGTTTPKGSSVTSTGVSGLSAADRAAYSAGGGNAAAQRGMGRSTADVIKQGKSNLDRMDQGKKSTVSPTPTKPSATPPAATKPVAVSSAKKPTTPAAPAKPAGSAMDQWAKANPKLAAAKAERDRTRGTSATTNPLMKDMKSSMPAPKSPAPSTAKTGFDLAKKGVNLAAGVDIFDLVKGHLLDEGYADTEEGAMVIMVNMSEEWRKSILESHGVELDEAQRARENPEDHDKEEKRKYEPVRGERTPMPPRGDKRREDFEKWYAKQMGR